MPPNAQDIIVTSIKQTFNICKVCIVRANNMITVEHIIVSNKENATRDFVL